MTMKFLTDVGTHKEEQNQNTCFDATGPVCKLQTKILKNTIFRNTTSTLREEIFAGINFREFFFRTFRGN